MNKLLAIVGPTATGKTKLALHLAKKYNGELLSADSRQVYKGMDIGTGKDIPKKFKNTKFGYYTDGSVRIWGYDLVDPKTEFSVAAYAEQAEKIIADIHSRRKLPILVGGTGLYVKSIIDGIATASIPKDQKLRQKLNSLSADGLLEILKKVDVQKAKSLNESDRKNPRRLIRAIEVSRYIKSAPLKANQVKYEVCLIGLRTTKEELSKKIAARVEIRFKKGVLKEITKLLKQGVSWDDQAMSALGYRHWKIYIEKNVNLQEILNKWKADETNYAKRQMTWFKNDKRVQWHDISAPNYLRKIDSQVKKWYSSNNNASKN